MSDDLDVALATLRDNLLRLEQARFTATGEPSHLFIMIRLSCLNSAIQAQALSFEQTGRPGLETPRLVGAVEGGQ